MRIRWLGHACMVLESETGTKVMADPFGEGVGYKLPREAVDLVTVSHDHYDHNAVDVLPGKPKVIKTAGQHQAAGVTIEGFPTFHDSQRGASRGKNLVFLIIMDGLRVVHCGDLGHLLEPSLLEALKPVDVLLLPVGGVYTINGAEAHQLAEELQPRIIIPMHYQTPDGLIRLEPLENFTQYYPNFRRQKDLLLTRESLPPETEVVVLDYPK